MLIGFLFMISTVILAGLNVLLSQLITFTLPAGFTDSIDSYFGYLAHFQPYFPMAESMTPALTLLSFLFAWIIFSFARFIFGLVPTLGRTSSGHSTKSD